jgi:branched-chain amino acid transport system substrate-binding protein
VNNNRLHSRARRRSGSALLAATCAVLVAACGASGSASQSGGSASKPLLIGVSLSLSGDFADSGKAVQRGYQLWVDEVNAAGGILGRKVQLKVVDDLSSPNQVVTNYQSLITRDHADLVFGPFSSLLTIPASQVAKRYGYAFIESAGGGPKVFAQHLSNLFFVQPGPVVQQGSVFADYILSLPAAQRPRTAAYPSLDDPFAQPIADAVRKRFEAAGIKTVYSATYAAEAADLTPVMAKVAAAKPDMVVSGTQSQDAFQQVKAMVQLHFSPKWLYMSNGANSPVEFPDKVKLGNTAGVFSSGDWFPDSTAAGNADFITAYGKKYGGTAASIDSSSAEAYAAGQILQLIAKRTGKIDNKSIIATLHSGTWPTLVGDLSWNQDGAPQGSYILVQWQNGKLLPVYPAAEAKASPLAPKPNWAG